MTGLLPRPAVEFTLAPGSEADRPAEHRGLARDGVRLLVAGPGLVRHTRFHHLPDHLAAGDLLVINTSGTVPAAVRAVAEGTGSGAVALLHVSTTLDDGSWVVEPRRADGAGPDRSMSAGQRLTLPDGLVLRLLQPYPSPTTDHPRLWQARPSRSTPAASYLAVHGRPVEYAYLARPYDLADHQTVYADQPGSAEMPSAGRPFTADLLVRLITRGVLVAPVVLHCQVSSPQSHEPPLPERYQVPETTARLVRSTLQAGRRVVAVGTTVVRALESAVGPDGRIRADAGWTDLVIGPGRPARVVTGLISGLHEPEASHLHLLESVVGPDLVRAAYAAAVDSTYLWHEFGDSMLFLPTGPTATRAI
jgi:S-adenosylmethionine:tRNA ribosyltransferase-isomerase